MTVRALAYEIRVLGDEVERLSDINARGEVSGDVGGRAAVYEAVYSPPQWVELSATGFPIMTSAQGINDNGQVAGYGVRTLWGPTTAIVMTQGGVVELGTLGGTYSAALDLNNSGQVTGSSGVIDPTNEVNNGESEHGFISAPAAGVLTDLGTLGGSFSRGVSINRSGQVTGFSTVDNFGTPSFRPNWRAFLYANGQMFSLGTLGGYTSRASAINDRGQVTGDSETPTPNVDHAFLWSDGVMTDLGTLGGTSSHGNAINYEGQVTGGATTAGGQAHAFLYSNGQMLDLNALVVDDPLAKDVNLREGVAINDSHWIVAQGLDSRGFYNWLLLIPQF